MAETSSEQGDFVVTTTTLDEELCRRLLGRSRFGRVAFIDDAGDAQRSAGQLGSRVATPG
jgi:hypothetical protein